MCLRNKRKTILCACGCGKGFIDLDDRGRARKFIKGHNKGHSMPHSLITVEKMRAISTGKKYSIESRLKRSINGTRGEKNNNWRGGTTKQSEKIRKSIEYKLWREAVFKRDNFTCQHCFKKESVSGKLQAHHLKPFSTHPELRFAIDNGMTLCKPCHEETDTYLWKGNRLKRHKPIAFDWTVIPQ